MAITRVAQSIKSGNGSSFDHSKASDALNVPAGALIVVKFSSPQGGNVATAPTDTAGNTYVTGPSNSGSNEQALWYCLSATANAANVVTAAFSNGVSEYGYSVEVYTGGTWTYDSTNSGVVAGAFTTSPTVSPSLSTAGTGILATVFGQYDWPRAGNVATQSPGTVINSGSDGTTVVMASGEVINTSAFSGTISANIQQSPAANTKCDLLYASFLSGGGGGGGAISGSANLAFSAVGAVTGKVAAVGAAALSFTTSAALKGVGALVGAASLGFTATASIKAAGALAGAAALAFAAAGTPMGAGALAGSAGLAFTATGTATESSNALAGAAPLTFGATGTLAGSGALTGSAPLAFAGAGAIHASGKLAGAAPLIFTAQATPSASASIRGMTSLTFTATGTLTAGLPSYPVDPLYFIRLPARSFYAAAPTRSFYAAAPARSFYVLSNPNMTQTFSNLDPRETEVLTFDASSDLADGETLTSIEKTEITVQSGAPTSTLPTLTGPIINGAPVTLTVNGKTITIATGCCVQVVGTGGISNCSYLIAITCATSNPDKVLTLKAILPVTAQ